MALQDIDPKTGFPRIKPVYNTLPDTQKLAQEKPISVPKEKSKSIQVANQTYDYAIKNYDPKKDEEKLIDELDNYQFLDGVKQGLKDRYNSLVVKPVNVINEALGGDKNYLQESKPYVPLEKEKKEAIKLAKEEYGKNAKISEEYINKKAQELFLNKAKSDQMHQLIDKALPIGYDREGIWKELKLNALRSNDKLRSKVASIEVYNSQIQNFDNYTKSIQEKIKNNTVSQEEVFKFNNLRDIAVDASNNLKYIKDDYESTLNEAKTDEEKLDLFKYNYNDFEKTPKLLLNTTKGIVFGGSKLLAETADFTANSLGINSTKAKALSEISSEVLNETENDSKQFYRYKASSINNWSDLGSFTSQLASEQLPILASIYMGGQGGLIAVSSSSGGQKINELEEQAKQPLGKKYSQGQKLTAGYLYSIAEYVPELFGTARILKDLERTVASASSASRRLFKDNLYKETFKSLGRVGYNVGLEGGTEYITAESQITIDEDLLDIVKTDYEKNEQRFESFASGGVMGGGMSIIGGSVGFGISQAKLYTERKDVKLVSEILKKIETIKTEIDNNPNLTEEEVKGLYKDMNSLNNKAFDIVDKNAKRGIELSIEDKSNLLDINEKQVRIREDYKKIKESNFSEEIKKEKLEQLNKEFKKSERQRNDILGGTYNAVSYLPLPEQEKIKRQAMKDLVTELNPDGKKDITITNEQVLERANKIYNESKANEAEIKSNQSTTEAKPQTEVQEQTEVEKVEAQPQEVESEVTDTNQIENEATQVEDTTVNGNIQPRVEPMGESGVETQPQAEVDTTESVPSTTNVGEVEGNIQVKSPQQGDKIELPPRIKNGRPRTMQFDNGTWKEVVGGNLTEVGKAQIEESQKVFDSQKEVVEEEKQPNVPTEKETAKPKQEVKIEKIELDLDKKINSLTDAQKKGKIIIINKIPALIGDEIMYYKNNTFYKGKTKEVIFNIKGRGGEKPTKEEISEAVMKLNSENKGDIFNIRQSVNFGNYVVRGDLVLKPSKISKEEAQNEVNARYGENISKPKKPTKQERKDIANAKIDEIVDSINSIDNIFGIKIKVDDVEGLNKQGVDIVKVIASIVKQAVSAGIEIDEAISKTIEHFKKSYDFELSDKDIEDIKTFAEPTKKQQNERVIEKEKTTSEKAKELGISEDDYVDFRDKVKQVPTSDEMGKYFSGETIKEVWGDDARNDQEYKVVVLQKLIQHGQDILDRAKELFGDNYIEKTLDFLDDSNLNSFEKGVIYASLENDVDTLVKETNSQEAKNLQDAVYESSQANLRIGSLTVNSGRLKRIQKAIKDGVDVDEQLEQVYTKDQLEAKKELEDALPTAVNLNQAQVEEETEARFTQEDIDAEVEKARKEWEESNLGFEIRKSKKTIKKEEALEQIKKLKENWRRSFADTQTTLIPYAKQLATITPDIIKLAKIYSQVAGLTTIDIFNAIKEDVKEVMKDIKDKDIKAILKKEFGVKTKKANEKTKRNAYVKSLEKSIEKLDEQIAKEERNRVEKKDKYASDEEIKALRKERDIKKEILEGLDPLRNEQIKLKESLKRTEKSIKEYERRLAENDFSEKPKKEVEAQLQKLRKERDLKRKQYQTAKKAYEKSLISDEELERKEAEKQANIIEKENERFIAKTKKRVETLKAQIDRIKNNEPPKSNPQKHSIWSKEISELENEKQNLIEQVKESNKRAKEAEKQATRQSKELTEQEKYEKDVASEIAKTQKQIDEIENPKEKNNEGKSSVVSPELSALKTKLSLLRQKRKDIQSNKKALEAQKRKETKISTVVKQALIDAGFGKTINVKKTVQDENGNDVKVTEQRQILDWTKLFGRKGTYNALKEKVESTLKEQGYTDQQISEIQGELEQEYTRLAKSILDKAVADLERKNKITIRGDRKSHNEMLVQLAEQGLFDNADKFNVLINKIIGFTDTQSEMYEKIKKELEALKNLYTTEIDGVTFKPEDLISASNDINVRINNLLFQNQFKKAPNKVKVAIVGNQVISFPMRFLLGRIPNLIQNRFSGRRQVLLTRKRLEIGGLLPKELKKQINEMARMTRKDIIVNGGVFYGDVSSGFINNSEVFDALGEKIDTKWKNKFLSFITLKSFLEAEDSYNKVKLTQYHFVENTIKYLIAKGKTKQEAIKFVSEALTGDSFEKSKDLAKKLIDKANEINGRNVIKDNVQSVNRIAMDIVKRNLSNDVIMTTDEINKIFDASYSVAGYGLGHEANNKLTKQLNLYNARLSQEINEAIKEERWGDLTNLMIWSTIHKSIVAPFAGGGANWAVLALEYGVPFASNISKIFIEDKDKKIDFTSEKGLKDLKRALISKSRVKENTYRGYVAVLSTMMTVAASFLKVGGDDDNDGEEDTLLDKIEYFLKQNEYLRPYFDKLSPISMILLMKIKFGDDNDVLKVLTEKANMPSEYYDRNKQFLKSMFDNETGTTTGAATKILSSPFNLPAPYKPAQDLINLSRGFNGLEPIKTTYKSRGAVEGLYEGGGLEWLYIIIKYGAGGEITEQSEKNYEEETSKSIVLPEETEETE